MFDQNLFLNKIKKIIQRRKVFIITGQKSYYNSGANKIFGNLIDLKKTTFYFKKSFYPEISELKKIIIKIKKFNPELVLAIGGGTVIDYAKIACCLSDTNDIQEKIISSKYDLKKIFKLIIIPTTAGSGAEVTSNSVIYIKKKKYSIESKELIPDKYFLNPIFLLNLNFKIKSSSGFDSIAQSIESLISKRSNLKSSNFAIKSLKYSLDNYENYLKKPNLRNSYNMALAANYSGKAISISKTTAPHALSYPFTSHFNLSHGHAVSLTLNKFLKFNYNNLYLSKSNFDLKKKFKKIFKATKTKNIIDLDMYLKKLKKKGRLEDNLNKLGINLDIHLNKILKGINFERLNNNPININKKDIVNILKS
jgi:alcohol dehydrogenase class IV